MAAITIYAECVTDLDYFRKMIIKVSFLTTFETSIIFVAAGVSGAWNLTSKRKSNQGKLVKIPDLLLWKSQIFFYLS